MGRNETESLTKSKRSSGKKQLKAKVLETGGIFDENLDMEQCGATMRWAARERGDGTPPEEKEPIIFRIRLDRSLVELLEKAETAFPMFGATDIIRRCVKSINRFTPSEKIHEIMSTEYEQQGNLTTTVIVRSCEPPSVDSDEFRIYLYNYLTKALSMPRPEPFKPSSAGIALTEADLTRLFIENGHQMPKGNYFMVVTGKGADDDAENER